MKIVAITEFDKFHENCCDYRFWQFPYIHVSGRYSNKNLSFGIVDLGLFPNAAEKFGISLSGTYFNW